jgi:ketosteroid isomerase-like protein
MGSGGDQQKIRIVLACFAAVERRDEELQRTLFHPAAEFHWPPSLPYGRPAPCVGEGRRPTFEEVWDPFQPTEAERRLDPCVVAADGDQVVVRWHQRGIDSAGRRFECPVLGLYEVRESRLARAQMFYFDTTATADFLAASEQNGDRRQEQNEAPSGAPFHLRHVARLVLADHRDVEGMVLGGVVAGPTRDHADVIRVVAGGTRTALGSAAAHPGANLAAIADISGVR